MDLNRVLLAGRLTADPAIKQLPSGDPVCDFRIAINRYWKDQETNEKREEVCFIDAKCYGPRGETIHNSFKKGKTILVEGRLRFEQWEKEGQKHSKHVCVVERFEFVDPAPANGSRSESSPTDAVASTPATPQNGRASSAFARRRREKVPAGAAAGANPSEGPF